LAVAAQTGRQSHWNPSAAHKDPTGPGLGAHKEETKASTAREKILQEEKIRPAGPTSYLDQDQSQELTKEIFRFGFNKNKMQTQNISLRTEPSLHSIRGGLHPPTLFLIGTKNWLTPNLD
jgi:hypothetical protein